MLETDSRLAAQHAELDQLAGFFESSLEPICIVDSQGRLERANAAWDTLRFDDAQTSGRGLLDFVHDDDRGGRQAGMARACLGHDVPPHRARAKTLTSGVRTIEWRFSHRGEFCFVVARDLTERLRIEQELFEQAERTGLALAGGGIGMWDWEISSGELVVDHRYAEIIGETPESLGNGLDAFSTRVHPEDLDDTFERARQHAEEGVPYRDVQFRMRHSNGTWRWIRASGKVVSWDYQGQPKRMVGIHIDVTERINRQLERDRAAQRIDRRMLSSMAARSAGNAGHSSKHITMSDPSRRWSSIDRSGLSMCFEPSIWLLKVTPSSVSLRKPASDMT